MHLRSASSGFGFVAGLAFVATFCLEQDALASRAPVVRVLVLEANELRMRADGNKPLKLYGDSLGAAKASAFRIVRDNRKYRLLIDNASGNGVKIPWNTSLKISSRDPRGIWLGKRRYRGKLQVFVRDDGLKVVNHLDIENYLSSVVGSEMPKTWPVEALKAQAVAARTYVLQKLGRRSLFDINSSELNQVYLGIEAETTSTTMAVDRTKSLVLTYQGKLINAVFHSASGGFTESSGEVWANQLPYLIGVVDHDQHSPKNQWEIKIEQKKLQEIFPEIGEIKSVDVISVSSTGRILKAVVKGEKKDLMLTGKALRKRLGLKSTLARFKMIPSDIRPAFGFSPFSGLMPSLNLSGRSPSQVVRKSKGFWRDWSNGGESIQDDRLPVLTPPPPLLGRRNHFSSLIPPLPTLPTSFENTTLLVRGFGSGHGVGLSQWGANGLAKSGFKFKEILRHYYSGVAIVPYW